MRVPQQTVWGKTFLSFFPHSLANSLLWLELGPSSISLAWSGKILAQQSQFATLTTASAVLSHVLLLAADRIGYWKSSDSRPLMNALMSTIVSRAGWSPSGSCLSTKPSRSARAHLSTKVALISLICSAFGNCAMVFPVGTILISKDLCQDYAERQLDVPLVALLLVLGILLLAGH